MWCAHQQDENDLYSSVFECVHQPNKKRDSYI